MKYILKRFSFLLKKKFVRDATTLQVASFFSTGLALVGSVIYARVLGVEGYAVYALIFVFVTLTSLFRNVGTVNTALTLIPEAYATKNRQKILDILTYYLKINLIVSGIVGIVVIVFAPLLTTKFYSSSEIGSLARIIILADMIKIFFGMVIVVLQATRKIVYLAVIENVNKILYVIIPASLVLFGYGLDGLVFGYLVVAIFFALFSFFAFSRLSRNDLVLPSWSQIFNNFIKVEVNFYFKFGFLIAIEKNLATLLHILPIFILGMINLQDVAFLKIAIAYAGLPTIFLVGPVSRLLSVQLPKSKSYSFKILKRDYVRSSLGSFAIMIPAVIFFAVFSPILIPLVYGSQYESSVFLSQILLIGTAVTGLSVGVGPLIRTLNLLKKSILVHLIFLLMVPGLLYYFFINYEISTSVYLVASILPLISIIFFNILSRRLNLKIKESG